MQAIKEMIVEKPEASPLPLIKKAPVIPEVFRRFTRLQIVEHWIVMILFTSLVVTGLPQRFFQLGISAWIVNLFGGIDSTRFIHRIAGVLFALFAFYHVARVVFLLMWKKIQPSMIPAYRDFRDAIVTLRYYLGLSEEQARFDRYDFRQKFEYFGVLMGGVLMIVTGFLLMYPVLFTQFLPGVVIPAAKTAHGYESLLAFLVIVIWHMYGAHFSPEVFPGDLAIFTGKISKERMEKDHPLEYERIVSSLKDPEAEGKG